MNYDLRRTIYEGRVEKGTGMTREQCENGKRFVVEERGAGYCRSGVMFVLHVRSVDVCASCKAEDRKEGWYEPEEEA